MFEFKSLELIDVYTQHFSGLSMRREDLGAERISAGLSVKVQVPVQEPVSAVKARQGNGGTQYMVPTDPSVWYAHFATFDP